MNSSDTERERFVMPQWLPFNAAVRQGELFAPEAVEVIDTRASEMAFADAMGAFTTEPGPFLAADLLGIAVRLGRVGEARTLAEYLLAHDVVGPATNDFARRVLGRNRPAKVAEPGLPQRIREARGWLRRFPNDAIAWVEQARLYTIIGQKKQAERAIERAVRLAPHDRFVVRSAGRFFIHRGNWERAHELAAAAAKATNDPWLNSLWISTGSHLGRSPVAFRSKLGAALAAPQRFHHSELIEACATHEVMAGSEKKARRMFHEAWLDPAKTVVTHSQWILREKMPGLTPGVVIDFSRSSEAMAWVRLMRLEFPEAVQSAREWALEEPYSTAPFMHGSFVDTLRENYEEAEALAREGLRANPGHHGLVNNLAFALAGQNRLTEAAALLQPMQGEFERTKDVALIATWGLVRMKQGFHAEGRKSYLAAIERARTQGDAKLTLRAVLNYLIAEVDSGGTLDADLVTASADSLLKVHDPRILITAERLQKRLRSHQPLAVMEKEAAALAKFDRAVVQIGAEVRKMIAVPEGAVPPSSPWL